MRKSTLFLAALCMLLPPSPPVQAQGEAVSPAARVIVKYKAGSALVLKRAGSPADERAGRTEAMGVRLGLPLRAGESVAERTDVILGRWRDLRSTGRPARRAERRRIRGAGPAAPP